MSEVLPIMLQYHSQTHVLILILDNPDPFFHVGSSFLEDFVEYIILPAIALASKDIRKQQEEMAAMLFALLGKQKQWMLIYMILNKCATALVPSSQNLPLPLQTPLQSLLLPTNLQLLKVISIVPALDSLFAVDTSKPFLVQYLTSKG